MKQHIIPIIGDIHGKVKQMYDSVKDISDVDTVIQIGDFQAFRNKDELRYSSIPERHRDVGEFPIFYKQGTVPVKTFFIGGNHENDHWHKEYPEGNELITNLFYLGRSGISRINGFNVGWVSGNYSPNGFDGTKKKKKYHHFTKEDIEKILNEKKDVDILLFHDWPSIRELERDIVPGSVSHPDVLEYSIKRGFGNMPLYDLTKELKPRYVFLGHMHMPLKFEINNENNTKFIALNLFNREDSTYLLNTDNLEK